MLKIINLFAGLDKKAKRNQLAYVFMLVGASIALLASIVLSIEALELARNKDAVLPCSINAVLNCATVASSSAASVIGGIPNSFFGMVTLPVMVTIAVAGLAGAKFPNWFMRAASAGVALGVVFAGWMIYVSVFVLQTLCPWCLTLDVGMLLMMFGFWRYGLAHNLLGVSKPSLRKMISFSEKGFDTLALVLVFVLATAAIIIRFGDALFL